MSFGGAPGLLGENDEGNGVSSEDLSGTYIYKEGIDRAEIMLQKALDHYQAIKLTANATLAGFNGNLDGKLEIDGQDICLARIDWSFA